MQCISSYILSVHILWLVDCEVELKSDREIIATKIQLYGQQPLIAVSAYRPPKNDLVYAQSLCQAIQQIIVSNPSAVGYFKSRDEVAVDDPGSPSTPEAHR